MNTERRMPKNLKRFLSLSEECQLTLGSRAGAEFPVALSLLTPHTKCFREAAGVPHRRRDKERLGEGNSSRS